MLEFVVTTKDGDVTITDSQLQEMLLEKISSSEEIQEQTLALAVRLVTLIESQGHLHKTSPVALAATALAVGYYYKVFLNNNKVKINIITQDESNESTNSS